MVLDSKIAAVRQHFSITELGDWQGIHPREVVAIDGVGPATLNHIRLYLAGRGIALRDDHTPEYWARHLGESRVGGATMADGEVKEICPFRIIVDSNETYPYSFEEIDNPTGRGKLIVPLITKRLREDEGDYQVDGMPEITVERKSLEDLYRTLAGRDDFKKQVKTMNTFFRVSFVVIEATYFEVVAPGKFDKDWQSKLSPRSVWHTINSWRVRYPRVHWVAAGNRRMGELVTFDLLYRAWKNL